MPSTHLSANEFMRTRPSPSMMALRAHRRGGPEQLVFESAPSPVPGHGEALVAVWAAGITFAELSWNLSWQTAEHLDRTPIIPSHEVAGTIASVTDPDDGLVVGQAVYGLVPFDRDGAAAEYVVVPVEALAPAPKTIGSAAAATLPLAALTAWQALVDRAGVTPGERVLVHGGAGGVGAYVVQLAVLLGARVTATAGASDMAFVQGLGADEVLDYRVNPFPTALTGLDVVIDTVGGTVLERSFGVLRLGGRLVTLTAPPPVDLARSFGIDAEFFVVHPDRGQLTHLADLVDTGQLQPVLSETFALADGRAAYESSSSQRRPGKTVLVVREHIPVSVHETQDHARDRVTP
jgi:NADPH:quinone reductase-like Zn-dependent oxidoreductase